MSYGQDLFQPSRKSNQWPNDPSPSSPSPLLSLPLPTFLLPSAISFPLPPLSPSSPSAVPPLSFHSHSFPPSYLFSSLPPSLPPSLSLLLPLSPVL